MYIYTSYTIKRIIETKTWFAKHQSQKKIITYLPTTAAVGRIEKSCRRISNVSLFPTLSTRAHVWPTLSLIISSLKPHLVSLDWYSGGLFVIQFLTRQDVVEILEQSKKKTYTAVCFYAYSWLEFKAKQKNLLYLYINSDNLFPVLQDFFWFSPSIHFAFLLRDVYIFHSVPVHNYENIWKSPFPLPSQLF